MRSLMFVGTRRLPRWSALRPYTTLFRSRGRLLEGRSRCVRVGIAEVEREVVIRRHVERGNRDRTRAEGEVVEVRVEGEPDRKSTSLNSSHLVISYAVICLI